MVDLCSGLGDVELGWKSSLQLACKATELPRLETEVAVRRSIGIEATLLDAAVLQRQFGVSRPGAIFSPHALQVNPVKLTYALLERAIGRGSVLLPQEAIDFGAIADAGPPFPIELARGTSLRAQNIVVTTGYETPEQFASLAQLTELRSTYAMVTEPVALDGCVESTLLWETGDPYLYVRSTWDHRVIVGGEDEAFVEASKRDALLAEKAETLRARVGELLSIEPPPVAYNWAGTFARTSDGLPFIDEPDRWPGVQFALGYGGNGITFGLIAARCISDHLEGRAMMQDGLYSFRRCK